MELDVGLLGIVIGCFDYGEFWLRICVLDVIEGD